MICPFCGSEMQLFPSKHGPSNLKFWSHPKADCKHSGQSYWDVPRTHEMFRPTTPKETDHA